MSGDRESPFTTDLDFHLDETSEGEVKLTGVLTASASRGSYDPDKSATRSSSTEGTARNQDIGKAWPDWNGRKGQTLLIVLDGHGEKGQEFSTRLIGLLESRLKTHNSLETDPLNAMAETFVNADNAIESQSLHAWKGEGACTSMVLLRASQAYVAHCGDCPVTLGRRIKDRIVAIQICEEHTPNNPFEKARIQSVGGRVMATRDQPDIQRIWPGGNVVASTGVAVSRSIGNFNMRQWGVVPDPTLFSFTLSTNDLSICLTSDGVSDVLAPQKMIDQIHSALQGGKSLQEAVDDIIDASGETWEKAPGFEGTYVDDATLVACALVSD